MLNNLKNPIADTIKFELQLQGKKLWFLRPPNSTSRILEPRRKGIGYFQIVEKLLGNFLDFFRKFWGIFQKDFLGAIFESNFLGAIFWENIFGRIFLEEFFWEDFLGGFFWEDFLGGFFERIFLGGFFGRFF